jgi:hypothetical protein
MSRLPCPFCGNDNIRDRYIRDGRDVYCGRCSATVRAFNPDALQRAETLWNRRPAPYLLERAEGEGKSS